MSRPRRARLRAPRRIADQRGEGTDDVHDRVPEILEVLHLPDEDGVAEVEIGRAGIDPELDPQWPARHLKQPDQIALADHLDGAPVDEPV